MKGRKALAITGALLLIAGLPRLSARRPVLVEDILTIVNVANLVIAAIAAFLAGRWSGSSSPQRAPWLLFGVGLAFYAGGQSVLAYHQLVERTSITFPSLGDPLFVVAEVIMVAALFWFAVTAQRSDLPFGRPLVFWSPALVVAVLSLCAALPVLRPVLRAQSSATELGLNLFYPIAGFVILAPCAVMVRVALTFRGGRLIFTWLPITIGLGTILVSDVLFSYVTLVGNPALLGLMDYGYYAGYVILAAGIAHQVLVVRATT